MAAVAAEPRAAGAPSTVGDGSELEPEPAATSIRVETECAKECPSVMDTAPLSNDGDAGRECQVLTDEQDRPKSEAAGKTHTTLAEHIEAMYPVESEAEVSPKCHELTDLARESGNLITEFLPNVVAPNEVSLSESHSCSQPTFTSSTKSSTILQHLHADHPPVMEFGPTSVLPTFGESLETVTVNSVLPEPDILESSDTEHGKASAKPSLQTGSESELVRDAAFSQSENEPFESSGLSTARNDSLEKMEILGATEENNTVVEYIKTPCGHPADPSATADGAACAVSEPEDSRALRRTLVEDCERSDAELMRAVPRAESMALRPESVSHLSPGSEVRVSLDHIIDDALVVSFQLGEKVFSGVLMDLSKRFGPYGIPVSIFPKREYRDKPESMQLKKEPFQSEKDEAQASSGPLKEPDQASALSDSTPTLWTSKPPPLFQEGVPYPPPLFIRDTYNQSLPQPPPRKIKRPKRRLYREEPTSILNAIRLRPRQVLCDKCKGTVVGVADRREPRRGLGSDCRGEEAKRRRGDGGATAVTKRPRCEDRGRGSEGQKRQAPAVSQAKGGGAGSRVVKAVPTSASHAASSTKKVLQSKNVDHSKAREVLKMAKAQRRQRDTAAVGANAKTTRASSLRDAHQKVHFTRRLHQISGSGSGGGRANPLPPRIRIKPQSTATLKGC